MQAQAGPAYAHGDSLIVFSGVDGPFSVTVGVLPRAPIVGSLHVTVTPADAATSELVPDAQVSVLAVGPDGKTAYRGLAINTPADPQYYDANFLIEHTGVWSIQVSVSREGMGEGEFKFTLDVSADQPNSGRVGTALWAAIVALMVGGGAYVTFAINRSQRRRSSTPPESS